MPALINPSTLRDLVEANAVRSASVQGDKGGYVVLVRYGTAESLVSARTSTGAVKVRKFSSLDSVDNFLRNTIHIQRYDVDSANFEPAPKAQRYEKNSERLKQAHQSAAYDKWLAAEIQAAIDDPRPNISNEQVKTHFAEIRAALRKRIADEQS